MSVITCCKNHKQTTLIISNNGISESQRINEVFYTHTAKTIEITKETFLDISKFENYNTYHRIFGFCDSRLFKKKMLDLYNLFLKENIGNKKRWEFQVEIHYIQRKMLFPINKYQELYELSRYELYIIYFVENIPKYLFLDGYLSDFIKTDNNLILSRIEPFIKMSLKDTITDSIYCQTSNCVLTPLFSALISHEILGHTFERCDIPRLPCNRILNYKDFANKNDNSLPVPLYYDDFGQKTSDISLISSGRIINTLFASSGTNRIGFPNKRGSVRMRNTAILPGKDTLLNIFHNTKNGIFLVTPGIGFANLNGNFEVQVLNALLIKNHRLCGMIKSPFYVSSNLEDFIVSINHVGNQLKWFSGNCFKNKEEILVGMGGPALSCRLHITHTPHLLSF